MKKAFEPTPTDPNTVGEAATPVVDGDAGASSTSPWLFVPSLYFMQGVPVVVVQTLSVTMYKKMGVPNADIGLWTSLIAWPWIAKMLWGPLVESNGTRRSWIVVMQALIIAGLGFAAFGIGQSGFLALTLGIFFIIAFLSATHDIAADGYYLLALREKQQASFVGIRSAFFRLAMIFATGFLVVMAGKLEANGTPIPQTWIAALAIGATVYGALFMYNLWALPKPLADKPANPMDVPRILLSFAQIVLMLAAVILSGRLVVILAAWFDTKFISGDVFTPLQQLTPLFLMSSEGQGTGIDPFPFMSRSLVVPFAIQLLLSLGIIAAAYVSSKRLFRGIGMGPAAREYFSRDRIFAVLAFILFYRFGESMLGKMASPFLLDPADKGGLAVQTQAVGVITGTVGVLGLTLGGLLGGWTISKWGIKKSLWPMVLALNIPNLFYIWLAFKKPRSPLSERIAGDNLPFAHFAVNDPTSSAFAWVVDFIVNIPSQIYNLLLLLWEALRDPVGQVIVVDQFGYGFGFAAYMVYLMFLSQGAKFRTSHYAISTGLMALGAMIAGIVSGYLQQYFGARFPENGYAYFFVAVCFLTIPGMLTLFFIPMDREDIKEAQIDID
jgi:PAT family beta-lactamase induction signal transducer AmpG